MAPRVKQKSIALTVTTSSTIPPNPVYTNVTQAIIDNSVTIDTGGTVGEWKKKIRQGESATTSLSASGRTTTAGGTSMRTTITWVDPGNNPDFPRTSIKTGAVIQPPFTTFPSGSVGDASSQAISRFISKCRAAQTQIQSQVAVGEYKDTIRTVASAATLVRSRASKLLFQLARDKKKYFYHATKRVKKAHLSERWLEFSFGVRPLVSDIQGAAKALGRLQTRQDAQRVQAGANVTDSFVQFPNSGMSNGIFGMQFDYRTVSSHDYRLYGSVRLATSTVGAVVETAGLSWREFVPTIWELIPYSFLVDYFTNIGNIIDAAAFNQSALSWCNFGQKSSVSVVAENFRGPDGSYADGGPLAYYNAFTPGSYKDEMWSKQRGKVVDKLVPNLEFEIPGLSTKWLNIAALGDQHRRLLPF